MTDRTASGLARPRLVLIALFLLFFLPVVIAWILNVGPESLRPSGTTNRGTLVVPPPRLVPATLQSADQSLPAPVALDGTWTMVIYGEAVCLAECLETLYKTRQARLALGKDRGRVQLVYVSQTAPDDSMLGRLRPAHPMLRFAAVPKAWLPSLRSASGDADPAPGSVFIVDPQRHLMMRYAPQASAKDMIRDMERLLKLSKIG